MKPSSLVVCVFLGLSLLTSPVRAEVISVEVQAVLGSTAVLLINGQQQNLKVGESHAGVTVIATQPTEVTLSINGRTETVGLSRSIATSYQAPEEQVVTIARGTKMHYQTTALINGRSLQVIVDTGANLVAMSSTQAKRMGIDYALGDPVQVETASGRSDAYRVMLGSVSVGGIRVDNVPAMVVRGDYPTMALLGMSYLDHVKMEEHNGILSLSKSH